MSYAEVSGAVSQAGFFGKLPSRGDFLRVGLPRSFTDPWDDCMGRAMAGSRALLGEAWLPAWMEAPVWRFALPAGMCGSEAALGVWMPSVDRAGRHFPLTLVQLSPDWRDAGRWLAAAEAAGVAGLVEDLPPEVVLARLTEGNAEPVGLPDLTAFGDGYALWWTDGSPFVPAGCLALGALPDAAVFASMIDAGLGVAQAGTEQSERTEETQ